MQLDQEQLAQVMQMIQAYAPRPGGGGGAVFTGVLAGTYNCGGCLITINAKGQITKIVSGVGVGAVGNMAFQGNGGPGGILTLTSTVPIGTFVPIGFGNAGTHPPFVANPSNLNFTMVGTTAPTQVLRYDGDEADELCIGANVSFQEPGLGAEGVDVRLTQNGVAIANTTMTSQTGGLITSAGFAGTDALVTASPGDVFQIELADLTAPPSDLRVSSAQLMVGRAP